MYSRPLAQTSEPWAYIQCDRYSCDNLRCTGNNFRSMWFSRQHRLNRFTMNRQRRGDGDLPAVGASFPGAVNGVNVPASVSADSTNRNGTHRLVPLTDGGTLPPYGRWVASSGRAAQSARLLFRRNTLLSRQQAAKQPGRSPAALPAAALLHQVGRSPPSTCPQGLPKQGPSRPRNRRRA